MGPTRKNEALSSSVRTPSRIHSSPPLLPSTPWFRSPAAYVTPPSASASLHSPNAMPSYRSSFLGHDASQSPSPVATSVSLLPRSRRRSASSACSPRRAIGRLPPPPHWQSSSPCHADGQPRPPAPHVAPPVSLVRLLPTPRRQSPTPNSMSPPRPPAPHSTPPVSYSQRHAAGQAPPPRALLSSSTRAQAAIEVIRGRERVCREGQRDPTSPLFRAQLRRLLKTKIVSCRAKFALRRSDKKAAGDSLRLLKSMILSCA
jgi:hypothetical protein